MSLKYLSFILGPIENNTYLIWDDETRQAAVIDPSFDPTPVIDAILSKKLRLTGIWLTHAHFDHIAGIPELMRELKETVPVLLHKADLDLYQTNGMASLFGFSMPELPKPAGFLENGQLIQLGNCTVEVRFTPGHCQGHVIFYSKESSIAFTGDLIFRQAVGRTDLPGSNQDELLKSIYSQVLTLPEDTILLSGHGLETSIQEEIEMNPYLN